MLFTFTKQLKEHVDSVVQRLKTSKDVCIFVPEEHYDDFVEAVSKEVSLEMIDGGDNPTFRCDSALIQIVTNLSLIHI